MRSDQTPLCPQDLRAAYQQLVAGAEGLLAGRLFFTERALLSLVSRLYRRRLQQLAGFPPGIIAQGAEAAAREAFLDAMAEAALGGHVLGEWESVENGYQARCLGCNMTSWVGLDGMRYSLLEDECPDKVEWGDL